MRFVEIPEIAVGDYYNKKITICIKETERPVKAQIPRMYMPFGVSKFTPAVGVPKFNIDFSMKGWNEDGNYVNKFYDFVRDVENKVKNKTFDQSVDIFGTQLSRDEIDKMFNSNIKESPGRDPKFRVKVDANTSVFDVNNIELNDELNDKLYAQHSGVPMVEIMSVYFINKMFGITWKMTQMKVYEPQRLKGFHFQLQEDEPDF